MGIIKIKKVIIYESNDNEKENKIKGTDEFKKYYKQNNQKGFLKLDEENWKNIFENINSFKKIKIIYKIKETDEKKKEILDFNQNYSFPNIEDQESSLSSSKSDSNEEENEEEKFYLNFIHTTKEKFKKKLKKYTTPHTASKHMIFTGNKLDKKKKYKINLEIDYLGNIGKNPFFGLIFINILRVWNN
jgi:hypothetical protein